MNSTTQLQNLALLAQLRDQIYQAFDTAADALMNTIDALLTETQAQSLPELSLSPLFQRQWHSLYEAFQDGQIDRNRLRKAFANAAPWPGTLARSDMPTTGRITLATDVCSIARPKAKTGRDRTLVHEANLPPGCPPVVPGWQFSTIALVPQTPSSWTYTLDNTRIQSHQSTAQVAAEQLRLVVGLLPIASPEDASPEGPALLLADGYYSCLSFLRLTKDIPCDKLIRLAKNRVLYRPAPKKTGNRGRPRVHGAPFKCPDGTTHGEPDDAFEGFWQGQSIAVACWGNLHFKEEPHLPVCVIRVIRKAAAGTARDPRVSWFVFTGERLPPLCQVPATYALRYSLEHGYRVDKQDLLWERVRLRTPEQLERLTDIVACVRNQLCLARWLVGLPQPWERRSREWTPSQVRRGLGSIMGQLGTPARACQPRGKSPGRAKGAKISPALRYGVIRKSPKPGKTPVKARPRLVQT